MCHQHSNGTKKSPNESGTDQETTHYENTCPGANIENNPLDPNYAHVNSEDIDTRTNVYTLVEGTNAQADATPDYETVP